MKDQELFRQLNLLSAMEPDKSWKSSQRSILLNQIGYNEDNAKDKSLFWDIMKLGGGAFANMTQPLALAFVFAFVVLTGGMVSLKAAQNTNPGDSLYAAKIVGEKTQFALAFSEKRKAELGLEFAVNRVEEIRRVIETEAGTEKKEEKVEQLVNDFRKEIDAAKNRISKISGTLPLPFNEVRPDTETGASPKTSATATPLAALPETKEDDKVFSAGSAKEDKGLTVSGDKKDKANDEAANGDKLALPESESPQIMLEKASELIKAEAYEEAVSVLEEAAGAMQDSVGQGEVQGAEEHIEEESATSSK
jgi:hypothetical protein